MYRILLTLLVLLSITTLSACNMEQIKQNAENQLKAEGHIAPTLAELHLNLPTLPNDLIGKTAQTYISPIKYIGKKSDTTYFYDKNGNPINKPTENGYYRHILGVTDDGRKVAQDFYATNYRAPQTAPFVLKQGADENNFDSSVIDSDIIWFDKTGNIDQVVSQNGQWTTLFQDGQIIGHILGTESKGTIVLNYPNSQNVMTYIHTQPTEKTLQYFYENGNTMIRIKVVADKTTKTLSWDENGKSVKQKKIEKTLDKINKLTEKILLEIQSRIQNV